MKKIFIFSFILFFSLSGVVFAEEETGTGFDNDKGYSLGKALTGGNIGLEDVNDFPEHLPGIFKNSNGDVTDITNIMQKFGNGLTGVAAALAVLFIILNCFTLITAVGETDKISNAKKGLIWSLVGLVLIVGSYVIVKTMIFLSYAGG